MAQRILAAATFALAQTAVAEDNLGVQNFFDALKHFDTPSMVEAVRSLDPAAVIAAAKPVLVDDFDAAKLVDGVTLSQCLWQHCHTESLAVANATGGTLEQVLASANSDCQQAALKCGDDVVNCTKDEKCQEALKCGESLAQSCGQKLVAVSKDPLAQAELQCVLGCGKSPMCVLRKCGKKAMPCVSDPDSACHQAMLCMMDSHEACSMDSLQCMLGMDKRGLCGQTVKCFKGIEKMDCLPEMSQDGHVLLELSLCAKRQCAAEVLAMRPVVV